MGQDTYDDRSSICGAREWAVDWQNYRQQRDESMKQPRTKKLKTERVFGFHK
jgi:hypothetical protein